MFFTCLGLFSLSIMNEGLKRLRLKYNQERNLIVIARESLHSIDTENVEDESTGLLRNQRRHPRRGDQPVNQFSSSSHETK